MSLLWAAPAGLRTGCDAIVKPLAAIVAALSLAGCTTFAIPDDGAASVEALQRTGLDATPEAATLRQPSDPAVVSAQVEQLLQQPLSADTAVRLALLQNSQLRGQLAELGVARADLQQAGLISNPTLAVGGLRPEGGGRWQLDFGLSQSLLDVLTRGLRRSLAQAEFARAQLEVSARLTDILLTAQQHYYEALAARHRAAIVNLVATAAETHAGLAEAYQRAGNITELEALTQAAEAHALRLEADTAALDARRAQTSLAADLGVADASRVQLPEQLPLPPVETLETTVLVEQALRDRLDLQALRQTQAQLNRDLALHRKTRGVTTFDAGVNAERDYDGSTNVGPEVSVSLPIFDNGSTRIAAAQARLDQNAAAITGLEIAIRNEVTQAQADMDLQRQRAQRYRETLIPQRERIVTLSLQRTNYMLTGPFETLLAKQQEYAAYLDYVDAVGGYWRARADLTKALGRALPSAPTDLTALPKLDNNAAMPSMPGMSHDMSDMPGMNMPGMDHPMPAPAADKPATSHQHHPGGAPQ
jgi:cobalt-zinc-cadmium efflux system outer membrane protein